MLLLFRRKKEWLKWLLVLVIIALGFTTVLLFVRTPSGLTGGLAAQEVAKVAGEPITAAQYGRFYRQLVDFYRQMYNLDQADPTMVRQLGIGQQALSQLINQYAAIYAAQDMGLSATPEEVADQVREMFQEGGKFIGRERYLEILRMNGMSPREFEDSIRRSILSEKLRDLMTDGVSATPDEVRDRFIDDNLEVKLRYVLVDPKKIQKAEVSEATLKQFFEDNKSSFEIPEKRQVDYVTVGVSPTDVRVTNEQIDAQMAQMPAEDQVRAAHILIRIGDDEEIAREKAERILAQIRAGANFAEMAREYSDDTASALQGGDLGYFGRGQMVPEFENVAFSQEPGQVSDLVRTPFGFHIIKTLDKAAANTPSMRAIAEFRARTEQAKVESEQLAQEVSAELKGGATLEQVAEKHKLEVKESPFFANEPPVPTLALGADFANAVFALNVGGVTEPFESSNRYVIARLEEIQKSRMPEFDEIRSQVAERFQQERGDEMARERAFEFFHEAENSDSFDAVAKKYGFDVTTTDFFKRNALKDENLRYFQPVQEQAFSLDVGGISSPIKTPDNYIVFQVADKSPVDEEKFSSEKDRLQETLTTQKRATFFSNYLQNVIGELRRNDQIQINQPLIDSLIS